MESATTGQSATSQYLSALPGRPGLGRGNFVLDGLGWKDLSFFLSFFSFFLGYAAIQLARQVQQFWSENRVFIEN